MSKVEEVVTLSALYKDAQKQKKNPLTKDEIRGINTRLMLLVQLSSLQMNIAWDIEQIFRKHGVYNFNIKHNHKKIVDLIKGCGNAKFWEQLTQDQTDAICNDADILEDVIFRMAGLRENKDTE